MAAEPLMTSSLRVTADDFDAVDTDEGSAT